jgi:hypothetical protein
MPRPEGKCQAAGEHPRAAGAVLAESSPHQAARWFRTIYVICLLLALGAFLALAVLVRGEGILRFDLPITRAVQSVDVPLSAWALTHVSDLGYYPLSAVAYAVVFGGFFALRLRLEAVLGVASSVVAGIVAGGIKLLVGRARPAGHSIHIAAHLARASFPSGHVTQYTTLFGFAFYVVLTSWCRGYAPR